MMTVMEVLLVLAVMAAIGYPLFMKPSAAEADLDEGDEQHKLLSAKEAAFVALKDLEFDFKTGKIDAADHAALKTQYEAQAVGIMKRLDDLAAGRKAAVAAGAPKGEGRFCASCGAKADADDRFCASCGKPLKK